MTTTDTAEPIRRLLDRLTETWNAGDAAGYADLFTEDADYITFFGARMRGRSEIEAGHRELFRKSIKLEPVGPDAEIRPLAEGAVVIVVGGASRVAGQSDPSRDSIITLTAVERPDGWRFASFQNTRVSDPRAA